MTLQEGLKCLFKEAFEGKAPGADGTWFVQRGEATEETLSGLSPEEASYQPNPGMSSIAAHVLHMTHYLQLSNADARGQSFEADWEGSWKRQVVTAGEWNTVVADLRTQKELLLELMDHPGMAENEEAVFGAIANIAHAAYHLGAVRQLFQLVKYSGNPVG